MRNWRSSALIGGVIAVVLLGSSGCVRKKAPEPTEDQAAGASEPAKPEWAKRSSPVRIEATMATMPYKRDDYPATFKKFGASLIPQIDADRKKAAEITAMYEACDFVQSTQVTSRSPTSNRHYWVECGNLTRTYFDEASLKKGEPVDLQTKADWIKDGLKDW